MSAHFILKCSCGAVIAQCRCMDCNKVVRVQEKACPDCREKAPGPERAPDPPYGRRHA